jgi:hypothetical protein
MPEKIHGVTRECIYSNNPAALYTVKFQLKRVSIEAPLRPGSRIAQVPVSVSRVKTYERSGE